MEGRLLARTVASRDSLLREPITDCRRNSAHWRAVRVHANGVARSGDALRGTWLAPLSRMIHRGFLNGRGKWTGPGESGCASTGNGESAACARQLHFLPDIAMFETTDS